MMLKVVRDQNDKIIAYGPNDDNYVPLVENGNTLTIEEIDISVAYKRPATPLSAWQIRKVLSKFGFREEVEASISESSIDIKDAWMYANEFERDDPMLISIASQIGITEEQLDAMFEEGVKL